MHNLKNSVQLIGFVGNAPEVKELSSGKLFARFSVATSETYKNAQGEQVRETQWHNIIAWNNQAKFVSEYITKGKEIAIEGKLITRTYQDKTGQKKYTTEINMNNLVFIGDKKAA